MNRIDSIKRYFELEEKSRNNTIETHELSELFSLRKEYEGIDIFGILMDNLDKCKAALEKYEACQDFNEKYSARATLNEVFGE